MMTELTNTWQNMCDSIKMRGAHLLESKIWSDCRLVLWEGEERTAFEVHQMILAMASPVFASTFYQSQSVDKDPMRLVLKDVEPDTVRQMLRYIYADEIQLNSVEEACALGIVAFKYMLVRLVTACSAYVQIRIKLENACSIYEFSTVIKDETLMKKSLKFICAYTSKVITHNSFVDTEISTLITICQQDDLNIKDEIELFNAIEAYSIARKVGEPTDESDSSLLIDVIRNIRYLNMSLETFKNGPAKSSLLSREQMIAILMKIINPKEKLEMPEGFTSSTQNRNEVLLEEITDDENRDELIEKELKEMSLEYSNKGLHSLSKIREYINLLKIKKEQTQIEKDTNASLNLENEKLKLELKKISANNANLNIDLDEKTAQIQQLIDNHYTLDMKTSEQIQIKDREISKLQNELKVIKEKELLKSPKIKENIMQNNLPLRCTRTISKVTEWHCQSISLCHLTFKVDAPVMLQGLQLPTQLHQGKIGDVYGERIRVYVGRIRNGRNKTLASHTSERNLPYNNLHDVCLKQAIAIENNEEYYIRVYFYIRGNYPLASTEDEAAEKVGHITVQLQLDKNRDEQPGLIRGLIFK